MAAGDTRLVVNFAEVPNIDSSGIRILVKAMASAKQRGGGVKLVTPSKFVVQTLKLIGVLNCLRFSTMRTLLCNLQLALKRWRARVVGQLRDHEPRRRRYTKETLENKAFVILRALRGLCTCGVLSRN